MIILPKKKTATSHAALLLLSSPESLPCFIFLYCLYHLLPDYTAALYLCVCLLLVPPQRAGIYICFVY